MAIFTYIWMYSGNIHVQIRLLLCNHSHLIETLSTTNDVTMAKRWGGGGVAWAKNLQLR